MKPYQRIEYLIEVTSNGNRAAFAKKIGANSQAISNLINRQNKPSFGLIESILDAFPGLNPDWLIRGNGEVGTLLDLNKKTLDLTNGDEKAPQKQKSNPEMKILQERIASLEREIELLKDNLEAQQEVIAAKNLLIDHLQKMKI